MEGAGGIALRTRAFIKNVLKGKVAAPVLWSFLLSISIVFAFLIAKTGIIGGVAIMAIIVGLPLAIGVVVYPKFGIVTLLIWSCLVNFVGNFSGDAPIGTTMDFLEYLLIIGFFLKQKFNKNWKVFANPIAYLVLAWVAYNFLQVANPVAASRLAWVYTVRTVAVVMLMYFIFVYQITDFGFVKLLVKIWLGFSVLGALYGYAQEINGYFPYEWAVLRKNPLTMHLYFQMGHWRKFSLYADPVVYAYNMAISSAVCLAMLFGNRSPKKKVLLVMLILLYMGAMLYSGTRAGYVLLPACLIMLVVLYFNPRVLAVSAVAGVIFAILIFLPTSNTTLLRFQSAFRPSQDASFNERAKNQAFIKPYIQAHPFGAGLGAVGVWGQKFAPNSELAKFPPDSSYVRIAVELGWVGLLLFCSLLFVALYTGINNFFLIKDAEIKNYCLAVIMVLFAFAIASYPQQSIVQFPSNIIFYLSIALINVLKILDDKKQLSLNSAA